MNQLLFSKYTKIKLGIRYKSLYFVLFFFALLFFSTFVHSLYAQEKKTKLRVGIFDNRPVIYKSEEGQPKGIYVDLLQEMAKIENWELEFVHDTWNGHLQSLRTQDIDIMTSIAWSSERDEYMDFSKQNVLTLWGQVYVKSNNLVQNILDLDGKSVAILSGGINGINFILLAQEFIVQCEFIPMDTYEEIAMAVESGEVDAGVINNLHGDILENYYDIRHAPVMFNPFSLLFSVPEGKHADVLVSIDKHISAWKNNPKSIYHQNAFIKSLFTPEIVKKVVPLWVYSLFALFMTALCFLILWIMAQRKLMKEKVLARINLVESEERFRQLSEASFEGIVVLENGKILDMNKQSLEMFQYTRQEFLHMNVLDIVTPEEHSITLNNFTIENPDLLNVSCLRKDGKIIFTEIRVRSAPFKGKTVRVAAIRDVTDHKRLEDALTKSLNEKDMLMREIHHRVKNNLNVIKSLLSIQLDEIDDEKSRKYFLDAQDRVESMIAIHDMLQSSDDFRHMKAKDYIERFVDTLFNNYKTNTQKINLKYDI